MIPSFVSPHTVIVWAVVFVIFALTTETMVTIAIVTKRRMKASGRFFKFGFTIEASDDEEEKHDEDVE